MNNFQNKYSASLLHLSFKQKKLSFATFFSTKNQVKQRTNISSVYFFSTYFNYLKYNNFFKKYLNILLINKVSVNKSFARILQVKKTLSHLHLVGGYNIRFTSYKLLVKLFLPRNFIAFLFQSKSNFSVLFLTIFTYFIKIRCLFFKPGSSATSLISKLLLISKILLSFPFSWSFRYFQILSGWFTLRNLKLISFMNYLSHGFSYNLTNNPVAHVRYKLFFDLLCKSNLPVDTSILSSLRSFTHLNPSKLLLNFSMYNSPFLPNVLSSSKKIIAYKNFLKFKFFFNSLPFFQQMAVLNLHSKVYNLSFYIPQLSKQFSNVLSERVSSLDYNLFRIYSNFNFFKPYTNLYSKNFEFYLLKLTGILTKRGLFLKAYSIIHYFFFRLHCLNASAATFSYFSDPFVGILPQLQLTQRFLGRNNHRSVVVPRLLHLPKRIPKLLRVFLKNTYNRAEHGFLNCFYFEYLGLLDAKANTFKAITEIYKQSIVNLQFIQSMRTSFLFDFKTRINPFTVNTRKRMRLRDDLYFF